MLVRKSITDLIEKKYNLSYWEVHFVCHGSLSCFIVEFFSTMKFNFNWAEIGWQKLIKNYLNVREVLEVQRRGVPDVQQHCFGGRRKSSGELLSYLLLDGTRSSPWATQVVLFYFTREFLFIERQVWSPVYRYCCLFPLSLSRSAPSFRQARHQVQGWKPMEQ